MIEYELMPHQKHAVEQSLIKRDLYLAFEVGTGKTPAAINALRQKYAQHGRLMKTLIVAPVIVLKNWRVEFSKFSKITGGAIEILEGSIKKRRDRVMELKEASRIFVTNYEVFQSKEFLKAILQWK